MTGFRATVVIPARDEEHRVLPLLQRIPAWSETLVVVDDDQDDTVVVPPAVRLVSTYGPGPANAIRYGIDHASAPVIITMCADGSDDPTELLTLTEMVEQGAAVACASRYMRGGHRHGGPWLARKLSRVCGWSLWLAGLGTHDASNLYKAYPAGFLREHPAESEHGFTIGLEMAGKARRAGLRVEETPTTWQERTSGESKFRFRAWLPHYLRWWFYCIRRK